MKQIWKFPLLLTRHQSISMPEHAEILTIQEQGGNIFVWAMVDPSAELESRHIICYGTGHEVDAKITGDYIATAQISVFVWHFFRGIPK